MASTRLIVSNEVLPTQFKNVIVGSSDQAIVTIRSNLTCISEINEWVAKFGELTNTKWNSRHSQSSGQKVVCSFESISVSMVQADYFLRKECKKFLCHHSGYHKVPRDQNKRGISKNADCHSSIFLRVKVDTKKTQRDDFVRQGLRAVIIINTEHSHTLNTAETLRFLPASEIREKFIEYFNDGLGISESANYHREVMEISGEYKEEDFANNRLNPTSRVIRHWYDEWRLLHLGPRSGPALIEKLKEKMEVYYGQGITVKLWEDPFAVVIVTPLMKRASALPQSAKIVFVDSTSSCDAENHVITFFLCPCAAGAVPLGIVITQGQSQQTYMRGFSLFKEILENPFNRNDLPTIFMTDNSSAEINALKEVWPGCECLLCIFHIAQQVWRWLWDGKHGIEKDHRSPLMKFFQNILYAKSVSEANEEFLNATGYIGSYMPTYHKWSQYIIGLWDSRESWCIAFRDERVRGHHTNNFSEVSVRVFKDNVLGRVKAYNIITLLDFCSTVHEQFYVKKLSDFANNRNAKKRLFLMSMKKKSLDIKNEDIIQLGNSMYLVKEWEVNMQSACCSCPNGLHGKLCKHQYAVLSSSEEYLQNEPLILVDERYSIACVALGDKVPPVAFYQPFLPTAFQETDPVASIRSTNISLPAFEGTDSPMDIQTKQLFPTTSFQNNHLVASTSTHGNTSIFSPAFEGTESPMDISTESPQENLLESVFSEMKSLHNKFGSSEEGLRTFLKRLRKVQSQGQWEQVLYTSGSKIPLKRRPGASIQVQPTSIARRKMQVTRGSRKLPAGRPAKGIPLPRSKRKHALSANIAKNQPNAHLHGSSH